MNFAMNLFSSNQQTNVTGIPPEVLVEELSKLFDKLQLSEKQKCEALTELATTKTDFDSIVKLVSGFLQAITREHIPLAQFPETLFRIVGEWQAAGARIDALSASRNLTPRVAALREKAQQAHALGDFTEVIRLLDEIDAHEMEAERRLMERQQEVVAELHLLRLDRIATKESQISAALAGLQSVEVAQLVTQWVELREEKPDKRFELLLIELEKYSTRGQNKGLNADLMVAIAIARIVVQRARNRIERGIALWRLGIVLEMLGQSESETGHLYEAIATLDLALSEFARAQVPQLWAGVQNSRGITLEELGKREPGTVRLEQAMEVYRVVLQVWTRDRVNRPGIAGGSNS